MIRFLKGVLVFPLKQLRRLASWLSTPSYGRALPGACDQQAAFPRTHSPLAAFEGLFVAWMVSALFWSLLTFILIRLR